MVTPTHAVSPSGMHAVREQGKRGVRLGEKDGTPVGPEKEKKQVGPKETMPFQNYSIKFKMT
jgi:hypothetical protein